jgi:2-keto-4-pentenoate hydratase
MIGSVSVITKEQRAARVLWQAWTSGRPLEALDPELRPADAEHGYAIRRALDELAGQAVGWKIAATSKAGQEHIGAPGPMVASRFVDFGRVGLPSLVADGMCGGHFVTGPSITNWRSLDLQRQAVRIRCNGEERSVGSGANVMGDPRGALAWMANEVLMRGWSLRAGEIVLTGASAPPIAVHAGDALEAVFEGLGKVEVSFLE